MTKKEMKDQIEKQNREIKDLNGKLIILDVYGTIKDIACITVTIYYLYLTS